MATDENMSKLTQRKLDRLASPLVQYVESTASTKLATLPDYGRVVLVTNSADVGSTLFRESPVLVWKTDNWVELLRSFQALSEDDRQCVLDMFHPPLDHPKMHVWLSHARSLSKFSSLDVGLIHKLLAISNTNAHSYVGTTEGNVYTESAYSGNAAKAALFLYGSKVAHSCSPNTAYSSRTTDGKLEYKVIRPIQMGEMATFSYLEKLYQTPTHIRRAQLFQSKSFICKCNRCMSPDNARQIRCVNKGCSKLMKCTHDGSENAIPAWICDSCGLMPSDTHRQVEEKEKSLQQLIEQRETQIASNCMAVPSSQFYSLVEICQKSSGPLHFLSLRSMEIYSRVCASQAPQLEQLSNFASPMLVALKKKLGTASNLRLSSAQMGLAISLACECIAAGCDGTNCNVEDCSFKHSVLYENGQTMFHACQDLLKYSGQWPNFATTMVQRYISIMFIHFGETDSDVRQISRVVAKMAKTNESRGSINSHKKKRHSKR